MNYEQRYNELIDAIKEMMEANPHDEGLQNWVHDNVPELTESEDEKVRKSLIELFKDMEWDDSILHDYGMDKNKTLAWLEKQDVVNSYIGKVNDMLSLLNKQGESKVSEPNWCHHKVDLSAYSEEYRKAYYDGWNNCNMQHSQCEIEKNDVVKCLIHGMKYYYEDNEDATWGTDKWSMPVKHIIEVLEKQMAVDRDKLAKGVLRGVANSIMQWLDANVEEGNMCLSNMECEDIENCVINANWSKVYGYMKKKLEKQVDKPQGKTALEAANEEKVDNQNCVKNNDNESKFKVKYANSCYNVLEIRKINGVTYYGIEDEHGHIDYVQAENCEIISGYGIKENGSPYPTKPAMFSEQNPTNEVKPKFHVGDWIINKSGFAQQVLDFRCGIYTCTYSSFTTVYESNYHLWTIADAKSGDVLAWNDSKCIAIFKNIYDKDSFNSYGFVGHCTGTFESRLSYHDIEGAHPATKEQYDTLMQAIAKAGYEFDFEKKELLKIEK